MPKMADPFENLTWDDFRLVKAVADARGMPGASSRLGVNQSTVFRRLGQVEALQAIVESIGYDGTAHQISIRFYPPGITTAPGVRA